MLKCNCPSVEFELFSIYYFTDLLVALLFHWPCHTWTCTFTCQHPCCTHCTAALVAFQLHSHLLNLLRCTCQHPCWTYTVALVALAALLHFSCTCQYRCCTCCTAVLVELTPLHLLHLLHFCTCCICCTVALQLHLSVYSCCTCCTAVLVENKILFIIV